jgi:hypothetical protein
MANTIFKKFAVTSTYIAKVKDDFTKKKSLIDFIFKIYNTCAS